MNGAGVSQTDGGLSLLRALLGKLADVMPARQRATAARLEPGTPLLPQCSKATLRLAAPARAGLEISTGTTAG